MIVPLKVCIDVVVAVVVQKTSVIGIGIVVDVGGFLQMTRAEPKRSEYDSRRLFGHAHVDSLVGLEVEHKLELEIEILSIEFSQRRCFDLKITESLPMNFHM